MARKLLNLVSVSGLVAAILLFTACSSEEAPSTAVARVAVTADSVTLPYGTTTELGFLVRPLVERSELGLEPILFVHLLNGDGDLKRTFDIPLDTTNWQMNLEVRHPVTLFQSITGDPLDPQTYRITGGLYEAGGERYPIESGNDSLGDNEFQFADVVVPDDTDPIVGVEWTGDWQDFESDGDLRIVSRRWLGDGGGLELSPVTQPLRVTMRLNLIKDIADSELRGNGEARVSITSNCGASAEVDEPGVHHLELDLTPPEEGESCSIEMSADSLYVHKFDGKRRSVLLELLMIDRAAASAGA